MAFSRIAAAKAKPAAVAPPPPQERVVDEDSGEEEELQQEDERRRQAEELARRRQAALEARRKAEEQDRQAASASNSAAQGGYPSKGSSGFGGAGFTSTSFRGGKGSSGDGAGAKAFGAGGTGGGGFAWKRSAEAQQEAPSSFGRPAAPADPRAAPSVQKGVGKGTSSSPFAAASGGVSAFGRESGFGATRGGAMPSRQAAGPSHDECEMAVMAMVSKTSAGMKEGLEALGLPSCPLVFVPGQTLKLCGHNVREEVNGMIHAWMTKDTDDFYSSLQQVQRIVAKPLLTEEEYGLLEKKEEWIRIRGPEGTPVYTKRDGTREQLQQELKQSPPAPAAVEEDSDDEVIDVDPSGKVLPAARSGSGVSAPPVAATRQQAEEQDYYALLGVPPDASLNEIRTKFRALVLTKHPEKGGDIKHFQSLNTAYSILSDQRKRREFDERRQRMR